MSYEPRGKVKALIDVMAPNPGVALPEKECAQIMGVAQSALPAYFDAPMRYGAIFAITLSQRRYYGITRDAKPRGEPVAAPAQRETTATGWKPPQMTCTRPTAGTAMPDPRSEDTVDGLPPGAPRIYPDEPREEALAKLATAGATPGAQEHREAAGGAEAPPVPGIRIHVASLAAVGALMQPVGEEEEQQDEAAAPEPVTWNLWEDGDLDLFGLVELENGGYRMPREALARLRKFIAWMPAC